MWKLIPRTIFTGLTSLLLVCNAGKSHAQEHKLYWGNPDIPVLEQRGFSLGVNFGLADLWSDVGTKSPIDHYTNGYFDEIRGMGGMFLRYTQIPGLSFRLGVNYGSLYATDVWNKKKALEATTTEDDYFQRYLRNLDVRTNIWEGNLIMELSPMRLFSNWEFSRTAKRRFQPVILLGVSAFHYNPQGRSVDLNTGISNWVDLKPLHTEGENYSYVGAPENYQLWSYAALVGLGFRVEMGRGLAIGMEYQLRYAFTDYLDDVSGKYIDPLNHDIAYLGEYGKGELAKNMMDRSREIIPGYKHQPGEFRGDPDNKDMFSTLSVTFFWRINKRDLGWWNWWGGHRDNSKVYRQNW